MESLSADNPPAHFSAILKSLWYDAKGDWEKAHDQVDQLGGLDAAWVHAYLHRKEGDLWNADYWYARRRRLGHLARWRRNGKALLSILFKDSTF